MTEVATLVGDLNALGSALLKAVGDGDWHAVGRYEAVRLDLLARLSAGARDEASRSQVLDAFYAAQAQSAGLGAAIERRRRVEQAEARRAELSVRQGAAYSRVSVA